VVADYPNDRMFSNGFLFHFISWWCSYRSAPAPMLSMSTHSSVPRRQLKVVPLVDRWTIESLETFLEEDFLEAAAVVVEVSLATCLAVFWAAIVHHHNQYRSPIPFQFPPMVVADSEVDSPVDLVVMEVSLVASPEALVAAMATPTADIMAKTISCWTSPSII